MGESMADDMGEFGDLFQVDRFVDLTPPNLFLSS